MSRVNHDHPLEPLAFWRFNHPPSPIHDLRPSPWRGRAGAGCAAGFGLDHRDMLIVRRFRAQELAGEVAGENEV
jgi:hypothetical protein